MLKFNKAEVLENGIIQLRALEVLELSDGSTRDGDFYRKVYTPDMNIDDIDCDTCKVLAQSLWTEDVIQNYIKGKENGNSI